VQGTDLDAKSARPEHGRWYLPAVGIKEIYADADVALQTTLYTCGPIALLNALRLKGETDYTEEQLEELCQAKPDIGTAVLRMVEVAEMVGLEVVETQMQASIEDLERNLGDGCNVIVCYMNAYSGNSHYMLLTDHDDQAFYCRDSVFGLFRFKKAYLDGFWYGDDSKQWYLAVR